MSATANPVLVEFLRGGRVESRHRGAVVVAKAQGDTVLALGDAVSPIFPRSAVKALQAVPLLECGPAHAYGLGPAEFAIACASHSGAPAHVEAVLSMLAKARVPEAALACGAHWPLDAEAGRALAAAGEDARPVHNNCSGKHAGMLALAAHLGAGLKGYELPEHPVQQTIRAVLEGFCGETFGEDRCAVDGCSVPTWAVPLEALARAFARFAGTSQMPQARAAAAAQLRRACTAEPYLVAGAGRFCTRAMSALGPRAFVKGGAEGVYCAALPESRLGVALKIDDGARRASEVVMAAVLERFVRGAGEFIGDLARGPSRNWRGLAVGSFGPSEGLAAALTDCSFDK